MYLYNHGVTRVALTQSGRCRSRTAIKLFLEQQIDSSTFQISGFCYWLPKCCHHSVRLSSEWLFTISEVIFLKKGRIKPWEVGFDTSLHLQGNAVQNKDSLWHFLKRSREVGNKPTPSVCPMGPDGLNPNIWFPTVMELEVNSWTWLSSKRLPDTKSALLFLCHRFL